MTDTLLQGREETHSPKWRPRYRRRIALGVSIVAIIAVAGTWTRVGTKWAPGGGEKFAAPGPCAQPYPGKQKHDVCADIPGRPPLKGLNISAQPLKVRANVNDDGFGEGERLCSRVTIYNLVNKEQAYSAADFTLQFPTGDISAMNRGDQTLGNVDIQRDLGSGVLSKAGAAAGEVCVPDPGQSGQYVLIYHPHPPFQAKRVTWILTR